MFLSSGQEIRRQIQTIQKNELRPMSVAVAYWGKGVDLGSWPRGTRILCDLFSLGCNPKAIWDLLREGQYEIRTLNGLHAKVVIGDRAAVVSSANISISALGEGKKDGRNWEAGWLERNPDEIMRMQDWFSCRWGGAIDINENLIKEACSIKKQLKDAIRSIRELTKNYAAKAAELDDQIPLMDQWLQRDFRPVHRAVKSEILERLLDQENSTGLETSDTHSRRPRTGRIATRAVHGILLARGETRLKNKFGVMELNEFLMGLKGKDLADVTRMLIRLKNEPHLLSENQVDWDGVRIGAESCLKRFGHES